MWFNDIDIELRFPSRTDGIAPERHQAALTRYLEGKQQREAVVPQVSLQDPITRMAARGRVLAVRLGPNSGTLGRRKGLTASIKALWL